MADRIVGVTGHAQHGKDTTGAVLVREFGFTRVSFAEGVYSMTLSIDPLLFGNVRLSKVVEVSGWDEAKKVPEVRRLLQVVGTEGVRAHIGDDAWILAAKRKIDEIPGPVVITDVRFANEAEAVWQWGGQVWRVTRFNADGSEFDNGVGTGHPSESEVSRVEADRLLVHSDVEELEQAVRLMFPADPVARLMSLAVEKRGALSA